MPAPGSTLRNGPRHNIVDRAFHKRFVELSGIDIPYTDFVNIINTSNLVIRRIAANNTEGFKLPETLGYIATTRYTPKAGKRSIDWQRSKQAGVRVYHANFHSFGYKPKITWYTDTLAKCRNMNIYKFVPDRMFSRTVSALVKAGKTYNEFNYEHFKVKKLRLSKITQDGF